ncbi:MAG: hypothetical protein F8N36_14055 [Desulfovibrio sp.]|uniref:hypothetical protein n=1 Tax=Desulfovibrio sp. TaxID=885 RepID=UPI00135D74AE|nr:hypothetical protein [Desulfovibrio sp.]MTJ93962.1 hypothetical protein [Desulfovibrio sp.]
MVAAIANIGPSQQDAAEVFEKLIANGDLSKLTPKERLKFYLGVCESLGLNSITRPFEYIKLDGRLTLYARKDCTDQLRALRNVSIVQLERSELDTVLLVTAHATMPNGRQDSDIGVVPRIYPTHYWEYDEGQQQRVKRTHPEAGQPLKETDLSNAIMKATTKAKRRVTLSICGLGFLMDETEVDDVDGAIKVSENEVDKVINPVRSIKIEDARNREIVLCPIDPDLIDSALRGRVEEVIVRAREKQAWNPANQYIKSTLLPGITDSALRENVRQYSEWLLDKGLIEAAQSEDGGNP